MFHSFVNSIPTERLLGPTPWDFGEGKKKGRKENTKEVGREQVRAFGHLVRVLTGWLLSLSTVASISQICCPSGTIFKKTDFE